jgi:hypothetical protein
MLQALNKFDTAPPIQTLLLDALDALIHGKPMESTAIHPLVDEVSEAQEQIGRHTSSKGDSCLSGSRLKNDTTEEQLGAT